MVSPEHLVLINTPSQGIWPLSIWALITDVSLSPVVELLEASDSGGNVVLRCWGYFPRVTALQSPPGSAEIKRVCCVVRDKIAAWTDELFLRPSRPQPLYEAKLEVSRAYVKCDSMIHPADHTRHRPPHPLIGFNMPRMPIIAARNQLDGSCKPRCSGSQA